MGNRALESRFMNRPGGQRLIRVVNVAETLATLKAGTYLTGATGQAKPSDCSNENAWSQIYVWGILGSANIKFQLSPDGREFFDYPAPTSADGPNAYVATGITAAGVYYFEQRLGNNFGRITWTNAGATADFEVAVSHQVV